MPVQKRFTYLADYALKLSDCEGGIQQTIYIRIDNDADMYVHNEMVQVARILD